MGIWHARFWVCLALLSLLMELAQGPKPIGAWWAAASVATERNQDPEQPSSPAACAMADSEGEEDSEDGEPDHEPLDEDPDGKPDSKSSEESGEEGDEELGKKRSEPAQLCNHNPYSYVGQVSSLVRLGSATKLSDLTYHEAPERPPRTV